MPLDPKLHIINLAPDGTLRPSGAFDTPAGQLAETLRALRAAHSDASQPPQLTLFFHGGLVSEKAGLEIARHLYPELAENGQTWPLFIVWESGLLETLQGSLVDIVQGSPLFMQLLRKLLKHVARKLPGLANLPVAFEVAPDEAAFSAPALCATRFNVSGPCWAMSSRSRLSSSVPPGAFSPTAPAGSGA